jgi:acyl-CoA thioester hydrolase
MLISETEIEVRYAETDQMGIVYHANYLVWLEIGRTKLVEELGFRYASLEKEGVLSPVIDLQISYKSPIRYGEKAIVRTWIESYDGLRITYGYTILTEKGEISATAMSKHVCVKKDGFRPISIRKYFPKWHEAYERAKKPVQ